MLTLFDADISDVHRNLLDSAIESKLCECETACSVKMDDINDILRDFANRLNYRTVSKPRKRINWRKEPIIKPQMNRAFDLRKGRIVLS